MVKKVFGYVVAVAVIAIIVFTVLGAGTYKSMLPEDLFSTKETEQLSQPMVTDSLEDGVNAEPADSLVEAPITLDYAEGMTTQE